MKIRFALLFSCLYSLFLPIQLIDQNDNEFVPFHHLPKPHISTNPDSVKMTDIGQMNHRIIIKAKYATDDNFLGKRLYELKNLFLLSKVATQLDSVEKYLFNCGFRLVLFDAYRPYSVTKTMYELSPNKLYVAHPQRGSNHNRGTSVDVTLADMNGNLLNMGTEHDHFTGKSDRGYMNFSEEIIQNRRILADAFIRYGFIPLQTEWWHFDFSGCKNFPLLDIPFQRLKKLSDFQYDIYRELPLMISAKKKNI